MKFEKIDITKENINPFQRIGQDWMLISAEKEGKVNTMTASWGMMGVFWGKNVVTVGIRPQRFTKEFVDAGCDIIVVHQEACKHLHRTIQNIKSYNIKAGVALNPATPIDTIKHVLEDVDMVLIMTVNPGFGGQSFIEGMISKIKELKGLIDSKGLNVDIQVDGGIKPDNVLDVVKAGANVIVAGSAIFNSENIQETVDLFRKNASK